MDVALHDHRCLHGLRLGEYPLPGPLARCLVHLCNLTAAKVCDDRRRHIVDRTGTDGDASR
jgi:hypothetical protein